MDPEIAPLRHNQALDERADTGREPEALRQVVSALCSAGEVTTLGPVTGIGLPVQCCGLMALTFSSTNHLASFGFRLFTLSDNVKHLLYMYMVLYPPSIFGLLPSPPIPLLFITILSILQPHSAFFYPILRLPHGFSS